MTRYLIFLRKFLSIYVDKEDNDIKLPTMGRWKIFKVKFMAYKR